MDVLPAMDLRAGQVVRLLRGDYDRQTTYSDDPAAVAASLARLGAGWIHVVDLDAARDGGAANRPALAAAARAARAVNPNLKIESGGGLRDDAALAAAMEAGVDRLVIGSAALKNWAWFEKLLEGATVEPGRIALGLDARDGCVAADGWTNQTTIQAVDLARRVAGSGLGAIVYTDISRDGMLTGVNLDATAEMIAATDVGVVASGGVASLDDVISCRRIGCAGVIIGKAWYEGKIDLAAALDAAGCVCPGTNET